MKNPPAFVRDIQSAGFENLTIDQLIRAKNQGVDGDFIRRAKAKGFTDLTVEKLVKLRSQDIIK